MLLSPNENAGTFRYFCDENMKIVRNSIVSNYILARTYENMMDLLKIAFDIYYVLYRYL